MVDKNTEFNDDYKKCSNIILDIPYKSKLASKGVNRYIELYMSPIWLDFSLTLQIQKDLNIDFTQEDFIF